MARVVAIEPGSRLDVADAAPARRGAGFGSALAGAVASLDAAQVEADRAASRLAAGEGNLHETALALEKADVAMRLAVRARNKVVDAYQEIMRMSL